MDMTRPRSTRCRPAPTLAAALAMLAGCLGDPDAGGELRKVETHPVRGKVMLPGDKPLTQGLVTFIPVDERGQVATGTIEPDGAFRLETAGSGSGAAAGAYKVKIETELTRPGQRPGRAIIAIPPNYQDEDGSGLTATIEPDSNDLEPFVLK